MWFIVKMMQKSCFENPEIPIIIIILRYQKCWTYCIFLGQKCSFHKNCHFHRKHLRIHVSGSLWIHGQHGLVCSRLWSQNQHHFPLGEHPYITLGHFQAFFGFSQMNLDITSGPFHCHIAFCTLREIAYISFNSHLS